jgi:hypothetical protein
MRIKDEPIGVSEIATENRKALYFISSIAARCDGIG